MSAQKSGHPSIGLHLRYSDAAAAVAWLGRVFGFTEQMRFDRGDGNFTARLQGPDGGTVMISGLGDEFKEWMRERAPRFEEASEPGWPLLTHAVTVVVEQVDAHHRQAEHEGAIIPERPGRSAVGDAKLLRSGPRRPPVGVRHDHRRRCEPTRRGRLMSRPNPSPASAGYA